MLSAHNKNNNNIRFPAPQAVAQRKSAFNTNTWKSTFEPRRGLALWRAAKRGRIYVPTARLHWCVELKADFTATARAAHKARLKNVHVHKRALNVL